MRKKRSGYKSVNPAQGGSDVHLRLQNDYAQVSSTRRERRVERREGRGERGEVGSTRREARREKGGTGEREERTRDGRTNEIIVFPYSLLLF